MQIALYGCDLGDECEEVEKLHKNTINLAILKARPNLLGEEKDQTILYETDMSTFFYVEPRLYQTENIYLMESTISLEDQIWDLIEYEEKNKSITQVESKQQVVRFSEPDVPLAESNFVSFFLRAASIKH